MPASVFESVRAPLPAVCRTRLCKVIAQAEPASGRLSLEDGRTCSWPKLICGRLRVANESISADTGGERKGEWLKTTTQNNMFTSRQETKTSESNLCKEWTLMRSLTTSSMTWANFAKQLGLALFEDWREQLQTDCTVRTIFDLTWWTESVWLEVGLPLNVLFTPLLLDAVWGSSSQGFTPLLPVLDAAWPCTSLGDWIGLVCASSTSRSSSERASTAAITIASVKQNAPATERMSMSAIYYQTWFTVLTVSVVVSEHNKWIPRRFTLRLCSKVRRP